MITLDGAIDIHVHAGPEVFPRIGDAVEVARRARESSMAGVVFKCHNQPSMTHAYFARRAVPEIETWGGIVLNGFVGGINPTAVAAALDLGARIVWMPTMHARNHVREFGAESYGISPLTLPPGARLQAGLTVLDETGALSAEARDVIDLAGQYRAAVATGHLGEDEIRAVAQACTAREIRCVVTHAFFPRHSAEFLVEVARAGAFIEVAAIVAFPMAHHLGHGMTLAQARDLIEKVGHERVVISSDAGQAYQPWPADVLQTFLRYLETVGVAREKLREMITERPRQILGLA